MPRYCTRERRRDDEGRREYVFVPHEAFRERARAGAFIEYRDFQFGMSYGLPWTEAIMPLLQKRAALGVINLGNVEYAKALFPEAVTVLVDASLETIRRRLVARASTRRSRSTSASATPRASRNSGSSTTTS